MARRPPTLDGISDNQGKCRVAIRCKIACSVRLVLIRHGEKLPTPGRPEAEWPLTPAARSNAERLSRQLCRFRIDPTYLLCSRYQHAVDTAAILAAGEEKRVVAVTGLTPHTDEKHFTLSAMLAEAREYGVMICEAQTIALVGHHPRLSQLARALTGVDAPEVARLEALVLAANSLNALLDGGARVERRCSGNQP